MNNHDGTAGKPAAGFQVSDVTETIRRALASAGLDTHFGPMKGVTDTIERALSVAGLMPDTPSAHGVTIDGAAREIDAGTVDIDVLPQRIDPERLIVEPTPESPVERPGDFLERSFATAAGVRRYKVYVPARYPIATGSVPMVVMLHGCTQSPDDFAAGTRMNAVADQHGFIVVYPEQCAKAHVQKCWNWFRSEDQVRDSGEPAIIAGITREVASLYRIDERRIFVAGMSAGAAMAVILGATYPELFAAIGAHSGLPYGVAHDVPSAFGAMHGGGSIPGSTHSGRKKPPPSSAASSVVPKIVFHGDSDHTVNVRNAAAIVEQVISHPSQPGLHARSHSGTTSAGRAFSRTQYVDDATNRTMVEHWVLHGGGHAWSGGSAKGSFTDAAGPDASAEMIRFFYSQRPAGTA